MADDNLSAQYESLSIKDDAPGGLEVQGHPTTPTPTARNGSINTNPPTASETGVPSVQVFSPARNVLNLLDLPIEVLRKIYAFVLKQYDDSDPTQLKTASPYYTLGDYAQNIDGDSRMPYYTGLSSHAKHLGLKKGTLSLLLLCSQVYQEAVPVLYGSYHFRSTSAESFRLLFVKHIGISNTKTIRRLCIGLPHALRTMPSKYLGRYLRMLEQQMPELLEFQVTTRIDRWRWPVTYEPHNIWIESHRGLLWVAAWVTRNHKQLKYAVWNESNTVVDGKMDDEIYIKPRWDDRPTVTVEVIITQDKPGFLQNAERPEVIEKRNSLLLAGEDVEVIQPLKGILLDCYKIRRTGFVGLSTNATCRPYDYQIDITIPNVTSESSKPAQLSAGVQVEELFLHNKNPELIFNEASAKSLPLLRIMYAKARALEFTNIAKEMLMKNGPPPTPAPVAHDDNDNNDDSGWGGADPGHDGGWGEYEADDDDDEYNGDDAHGYADNDDYFEDGEDSEWSGYTSDHDNYEDDGVGEPVDHGEANPTLDLTDVENAGDDSVTPDPASAERHGDAGNHEAPAADGAGNSLAPSNGALSGW